MKMISTQLRASLRLCPGGLVVAWLLAASLSESWAINNSNVTFSGITTNFNNVLTWPWDDTGTNNTLSILNGAVVIDTAHWFGGINGPANRNFVIISGNGSLWSNNSVNSFIGRFGSGDQLIVSNGGAWVSANALIGSFAASASNNSVLVTGPESRFKTGDLNMGGGGSGNSITARDQGTLFVTANTLIGSSTDGNQIVITNGGRFVSLGIIYVGGGGVSSSPTNNAFLVDGAGTIVSNNTLVVGDYGNASRFTVSGGAQVQNSGTMYIGNNGSSANSNQVLITGAGSVLSTGGTILGGNGNSNLLLVTSGGTLLTASITLGNSTAANNTMIVTNGGHVYNSGTLFISEWNSPAASNNTVIVTGAGSVVTNGGTLIVGRSTPGNRLTISDGGLVVNAIGYLGASLAGGANNSALVTGAGSVWSNTSSLTIGNAAAANSLVVSNGGRVYAVGVNLGAFGSPGTSNNVLVATGDGTLVQSVTSGLTADNAGSVLIANGATLDAPALASRTGSSISNLGGVFQFATYNPIITASGGGVIVLSNGVLSFRNVTNADVYAPNNASVFYFPSAMTFLGNNTFRLNNSSNQIPASTDVQDYTFDTGRGATNFARLELVNGTTYWQSKYATFGANGSFLASNTVGTVAAVVTNLGKIEVSHSTVTWASNMVLSGSYRSDPSTNNFLAELTVTRSGTLTGGAGDVFNYQKSLWIQSTNNSLFDLSSSTISFKGGGNHTNAVTGGDFGTNLTVYPNANFTYGTLTLASAIDQLYFVSGGFTNGLAGSNALYVTQLNLFNNSGALDSSLVANLHSPFNIYYLSEAINPGDAYLNDTIFPLSGGGSLLPFVPEPTTVALLGIGAMLWLRRRQ